MERFAIECSKTKTKLNVIKPVNQKKENIANSQENYLERGKTRVTKSKLVSVMDLLIGWKSGVSLSTNHKPK